MKDKTTIMVQKDTVNKLVRLKIRCKAKHLDYVIRMLIKHHRETRKPRPIIDLGESND